MFRHHGLPNDIISDRGPQLISHFWKHLWAGIKISCKLSSAYHPQTDGQTERTNQTLEQYLRCFISYQQDDWSNILHLAEFAYNNTVHSSTKVTPFFAYTGNHPRWCIVDLPEVARNPSAEHHLHRLHRIQLALSSHLQAAQAQHKTNADRYRLKSPFKVGDRVWLLRRHIKTTRPCEKLDYQRLGPFLITARINDATFRLNLPAHMRLHPVFHSSLLEPCRTSSIPNRVVPPPPSIELADGPEYEVAAILDSKIVRNKLYYLVDWVGYPPSDRTWEPVNNVSNAQALVDDFHRRYPNKPGPTLLTPTSTRRSRRGDSVMNT